MEAVFLFKQFVADSTQLDRDALHIYVAVLVLLGSCAVFRWKVGQWKPLLLVMLVAMIGEGFDMRYNMITENDPFVMGSLHDLWNTMLVPLIIFAFARLTHVFALGGPAKASGNKPQM